MKDFGCIPNSFGIQFEFTQDYAKVHHTKYVEKILSKFKMSDCNLKSVPCAASVEKLYNNSETNDLTDRREKG